MDIEQKPPHSWPESSLSFASMWAATAQKHGALDFLVFKGTDGTLTSWTYREFGQLVEQTASKIRSLGVRPGDSIHLCLKNSPAFIVLWLAAARLGAWIVPVDPASAPRDIAKQIKRVRPRLGFCAIDRADTYRAGSQESDVVVIELKETAEDLDQSSSPLLATEALPEATKPNPEDRLAVMFTSGTTSEPKGVKLTQANYANVGRTMAATANLETDNRWFVTLPLFHANAQFYCFASAIAVGASVGLTSGFSASRWVTESLELGATHASLFAAPMRMILARTPPDQTPGQLSHVWFAQNLGSAHHAEFSDLAGCAPRQLYGMSETLAIVTYDSGEIPRHDVIGEVIPHRHAKLLDPHTYLPVPLGHPGMIAVAGTRGLDLFIGYLDDPVTTERAFITDDKGQEWFLTGDLAVADQSGTWSFVGRVDDIIKVAGENVSLSEVESAVAEAPGVLEAAIIPLDDEMRDVVPIAYVVPRQETTPPTADQLRCWAEQNLAPAARPREWHFIDELPRTSVGKLRRFKLTGKA